MSTATVPLRSEIPVEYTWDLASIFPTPAAWEAQLDAITLHQDFREYGRDDVGVTSATFSLRPG